MKRNPYPEFLIDEVSGIEVLDIRHQVWAEGYQAGSDVNHCINLVIRCENGMVAVFDGRGEQMPGYQGQYEQVKSRILSDAPANAVFLHGLEGLVNREEW